MTFKQLETAQIEELQLMLEDEFPEFVRTFISHSDNLISLMKEQLSVQDNDAFIIGIHSLKGSCRNIGAELLANSCLEVELLARKESILSVDPELSTICQEFTELKETLSKLARI